MVTSLLASNKQAIWPRYVRCHTCQDHWRIEKLTPSTGQSIPRFCPLCGCEGISTVDRDRDYWYILAEGFGFQGSKGVDLVKGLYELWNPAEHNNFRSFVEATLKEYTK